MKPLPAGIFLLFLAACGQSPEPPKPQASLAPAEMRAPSPAPAGSAAAVPGGPPAAAPAPGEKKEKEPVDKKGRSKSPELFKKYLAFMEDQGELFESITADVEGSKGETVIKPKVTKIIQNALGARALHYRKNPDEDKELDDDFELFLFKLRTVQEATWDEDHSKELLERIQRQCRVCHDKFQ
ncbi:MAG TPA: hypothetical protein VEN81_00315 [Planctomycetota bacterium]|jgi:hypothetical protein|nr:hypothetical protein [Planctomycetota bacterium]